MVPHDLEYLVFENIHRKRQVDSVKRISVPHYSRKVEMSGGGSVAEIVIERFVEADLTNPVQQIYSLLY